MKSQIQQDFSLYFQMFEFNDVCWEKCQSDKVDSKTETCLSNCVNRFIDVSLFITNRYGQLLSKSMEGGL